MKKIIFLSSIFISTLTFAQKEGNLMVPKWEAGDSYEYKGIKSETFANLKTGESIRSNIPFKVSFSIIEDTESAILFRINAPNFEWFNIIEIISKYNLSATKDIKQIDLICSYDKKTGVSKLLNQSEVIEIFNMLKSSYPKWVGNNSNAMGRINKEIERVTPAFSTEEAVIKTFKNQIEWFTSSFNKKQVLDQDVKSKSVISFTDFGNIPVKTNSKITQINKEETSFTQENIHSVDGEQVKNAFIINYKNKDVLKSADMERIKQAKSHSFSSDLTEKVIYNYKTTVPVSIEKNYEIVEKSNDIVITERLSTFNLSIKK